MTPLTYQIHRRATALITLVIISTVFVTITAAQQGGLDLTFGTNSTGIWQDPLPILPLPENPPDRARYFGVSEVLPNGKTIVAGTVLTNTGSYAADILVRRLNVDGSLDETFGVAGEERTTFYRWGSGAAERSSSGTYAMKVQPDGKILVASQCSVGGSAVPNGTALGTDLCMVRYNANGLLDTSFGGGVVFSYGGNPNFPGNNNVIDPGKVFTLTGVNQINGATIGFGGIPARIRIAPDGRIFVFGRNSHDIITGSGGFGRNKSFVAIYSTSGGLQNLYSIFDTTGSNATGWGNTNIYDGEILSNGDYVAVGDQRVLTSSEPVIFSVPRWRTFTGGSGGGFLDADVNAAGRARGIAMTRGNKILVSGESVSIFGVPTMVRYNGDLSIDTTFGINGRQLYDGVANLSIDTFHLGPIKVQNDGKIIGTTNNGAIARFNANGSLDRSFARLREDVADSLSLRGVLPWGRYVTPFPVFAGTDARIGYGGISVRPNGKIVTAGVVGEGAISGPSGRGVVTQLKASLRQGGVFSDGNGDGKSDIAVFRPTDGIWHQLDSFNGSYNPVQWGVATDKLAPADYDGDGRTDVAVFRDGVWYITQSSNNQVRYEQWGSAGDLPRPGDFNGDGYADIAVFRPVTGTWYILYSSPIQPGNITYSSIQFGQNGDRPLMADFDGDGKSDVSVFRGGIWYFIRSSDASIGITQFGLATDIPVTADYDGDGRSDIAVFRDGVWYVQRSSDGTFLIVQFGIAGDRPVPGDYDNDGISDIAIFRDGVWWVLGSSDNQATATAFGLGSDIPLQTAYLQ